MGGEELLPTWQQSGGSYTCQEVSQVLNINNDNSGEFGAKL